MANVFDVAEHILARFGSASAIKLQKLVYYSQAWHLVARSAPLFSAPTIAYQYGPLNTTLWERHRGLKTVRAGHFVMEADGDLSPDAASVVDAVLDFYGPMSMTALVDRTHREQPWIVAQATASEISTEEMRLFYAAELASGGSHPNIVAAPGTPSGSVIAESELTDDYSAFLSAISRDR